MPDDKRYYWLKLHDDFFDSKRIKKLRKMAGGDTYTIIYLKMQLVAMKNGGVLKWTGLEADIAEELALDLNEETEDVKVTLAYLLSCGLAETSDNISYFFPYAVSNVGSEGSSAQRMREHRERLGVSQSRHKVEQSDKNVTERIEIDNRDRDKSIEIDIENRDIDRESIDVTNTPITTISSSIPSPTERKPMFTRDMFPGFVPKDKQNRADSEFKP